jgi:glutamyl-tRNA reductase
MAEDLINQFKKKCEIYICARNKNAIENLKLNHEINVIEWGDYKSIITFAHIANTIGAKEIIFNKVFFENWKNAHHDRTFVDLGSPSAIDTNLTVDDGIIRLENIFSEGAIKENHKKQQIVKAKNAMDGIVEKRQKVFEKKALYHIPNPGQAKYVRK